MLTDANGMGPVSASDGGHLGGSASAGTVDWPLFRRRVQSGGRMAFRDVGVFEAREVLRLWLAGQGCRSVERLAQVLRQDGRRYVSAAEQLGLVRDSGGQLSEVFVGMVMDAVCPYRRAGRGEAWQLLSPEHERIAGRAKGDLRG